MNPETRLLLNELQKLRKSKPLTLIVEDGGLAERQKLSLKNIRLIQVDAIDRIIAAIEEEAKP